MSSATIFVMAGWEIAFVAKVVNALLYYYLFSEFSAHPNHLVFPLLESRGGKLAGALGDFFKYHEHCNRPSSILVKLRRANTIY